MADFPERIDGPRVTLRWWRASDVAALAAAIAASVEHLRPWMSWIADEPLADGARLELIESWARDRANGGDVVYGVFLGDAPIGGSGFHRRADPDTLEIGYWIHVDHVGHGYAREAVILLTDTAFTDPAIDRVEIHHDRANTRSGAIPAALGFRCDGEIPDEIVAPGEVGIDVTWSVTADAWRAARPAS